MLGTQTRGGRKEGADKSTVLWPHPSIRPLMIDIGSLKDVLWVDPPSMANLINILCS